mgnify:FL=1
MEVTIEDLGPLAAHSMLAMNTGNRPRSQHNLDKLAREMSEGRWRLNGDAIRISASGRLLDGQHRLYAIIKSGCTVKCMVVRGLDDGVFDTIDTNKIRSPGDVLAISGESHARNIVAALRLVEKYKSGKMLQEVELSNTEVLPLLSKYPAIRDSVRKVTGAWKLTKPSVLSACHYLFSEIDAEDAESFFSQLESGEGLKKGSAILSLRERLLENAISKGRLSQRYLMALFVKSWNAYRTGREIRCLAWRDGGENPQPFPVAI